MFNWRSDARAEIVLFKVQWWMPHVLLNEINKLSILRTLENGRYLSMAFCSWDLYEFPLCITQPNISARETAICNLCFVSWLEKCPKI